MIPFLGKVGQTCRKMRALALKDSDKDEDKNITYSFINKEFMVISDLAATYDYKEHFM